LLKEDAIPTLFSHSKQTQKRQASEKRSHDHAKRKLVEDAVNFHTQMKKLNKECEYLEKTNIPNTKAVQTTIVTKSVSTQTAQTFREIGIQTVEVDYTSLR
jgi:hypothetical protein